MMTEEISEDIGKHEVPFPSLKRRVGPWLVWLKGLSAHLLTERWPVQFLVRTHAWVVSQVPSWGV